MTRARATATRLALAAGQLAGAVAHAASEADLLQQRPGALAAAAGTAADEGGHHHVLKRGELGQEVVELEDEADVAVAEVREAAVVEGEDVDAGNLQAAGGGPVEGAEDVEEGALADAGGPGDAQGLAGEDLQVDALEHLQPAGAGGIDAPDAAGPQDRRLRALPAGGPGRGRVRAFAHTM